MDRNRVNMQKRAARIRRNETLIAVQTWKHSMDRNRVNMQKRAARIRRNETLIAVQLEGESAHRIEPEPD
jgi:hypothetical protein